MSINIESIPNFQNKITYTKSADYKFDILSSSMKFVNNFINFGDFNFVNISPEVDQIFTNDYGFDFLEEKLIKKETINLAKGYNVNKIKSLIYNPSFDLVIHDDIFENLDNVYTQFQGYMFEIGIQKPIYNKFKLETTNYSNYLKVCFDEDNFQKISSGVSFFYLSPLYDLSRLLTNQLFVNIKKETHTPLLAVEKEILNLKNSSLSNINSAISDYIVKIIFKNINFNSLFINDIKQTTNLNDLQLLFNNYVSNTITDTFLLRFANSVYFNYIEEFSYKLATSYRTNNLITYLTPRSIYSKIIEKIIDEYNLNMSERHKDIESIVTITHKYKYDYLQFINSTLIVFNDWLDLLIENSTNKLEYDLLFSKDDVSNIIRSIIISNRSVFINHLNSNFLNEFISSKTIELASYNFISELVASFFKTAEFENYFLNNFLPNIVSKLKYNSPKLYKELFGHSDKIINYLKYLMTIEIYKTSRLPFVYREVINTVRPSTHIQFNDYLLTNILNEFYKVDSQLSSTYKKEFNKFILSMSTLYFLDDYIDNFRLIRKNKPV